METKITIVWEEGMEHNRHGIKKVLFDPPITTEEQLSDVLNDLWLEGLEVDGIELIEIGSNIITIKWELQEALVAAAKNIGCHIETNHLDNGQITYTGITWHGEEEPFVIFCNHSAADELIMPDDDDWQESLNHLRGIEVETDN